MKFYDFVNNSFSSIKGGLQGIYNQGQAWVKDKMNDILASTVDNIAESANKVIEQKVTSTFKTLASQLGQASTIPVDTFQSFLETGIRQSSSHADNVYAQFMDYMQQCRQDLDKKKTEINEDDPFFKILHDTEEMYKKLEKLGEVFHAGKINLEDFAHSGRKVINQIKPLIQDQITEIIFDSLMSPLLGFFTQIINSLFKSITEELRNPATKTPDNLDADFNHEESTSRRFSI